MKPRVSKERDLLLQVGFIVLGVFTFVGWSQNLWTLLTVLSGNDVIPVVVFSFRALGFFFPPLGATLGLSMTFLCIYLWLLLAFAVAWFSDAVGSPRSTVELFVRGLALPVVFPYIVVRDIIRKR